MKNFTTLGHHICTMLDPTTPSARSPRGKAKAFDKLAAFYDACAQVEIDEYRDYDKAEQRAVMHSSRISDLAPLLFRFICWMQQSQKKL